MSGRLAPTLRKQLPGTRSRTLRVLGSCPRSVPPIPGDRRRTGAIRGCAVRAFALIVTRKVDVRKFITRTLPFQAIPDAIGNYKQGTDLKMIVHPWA